MNDADKSELFADLNKALADVPREPFPWNQRHTIQDLEAGLCSCGRVYAGPGLGYAMTRLAEHVDFWTPIIDLPDDHPLSVDFYRRAKQ